MSQPPTYSFTHGPLGAIFARTALPIIFVMSMNGLLTVTDAVFLGHYSGAAALAAVTLMFPAYMVLNALAVLVAGGMSSLLARHLGGKRYDDARAVFAGAHGLALALGALLIVLYLLAGGPIVRLAAGGSGPLADLGGIYLRIIILASPVMFLLAVQGDALRNEGRAGLMALMSLAVSLANILFNYVLIARFDMGVAGSAYGTVLAQAVALVAVFLFRWRGETVLRPGALLRHGILSDWPAMLALGAPLSLNFIGIALGSASIMTALQMTAGENYQTVVSAYGIVTRVLTFAYLPLLGLSQAMQSITGNNYGAALWRRSDDSIRLAIGLAFLYCLTVQIAVSLHAPWIGGLFVADTQVIAGVGRIMPMVMALYLLSGPNMMVAAYFQAIGDVPRAAVLGLSRPYVFSIPMTVLLACTAGEPGIWMATASAEALLFLFTLFVLAHTARRRSLRFGLFTAAPETLS